MAKERRTFTPEDRLSILQEAQREGQAQSCRRYNLSISVMLRWMKKYPSQGINGLKPAYRKVDPGLRDLEEENERLNKNIARQALQLEVESELLRISSFLL